MTPLASKIFRNVTGPLASQTQRELASAHYFECSALAPMAMEMRMADGLDTGYSPMAQLPAPKTGIEAVMAGQRMLFCCTAEDDGYVAINCLSEVQGGVSLLWQAAFLPDTKKYRIQSEKKPTEQETQVIIVGTFLVERFLCIINQPGLVDRLPHDSDKRIARIAKATDAGSVAPKWHECRIRSGVHSGAAAAAAGIDSEAAERQLHYVRKHFKPSLDRWIDGYWRGNADLGIYLKWYSVRTTVPGGRHGKASEDQPGRAEPDTGRELPTAVAGAPTRDSDGRERSRHLLAGDQPQRRNGAG